MSDKAKRDAVMAEFKRPYFGLPDTYALIDEIVRLRAENAALTAAVERVRALHEGEVMWYPDWDDTTIVCLTCNTPLPCPTIRALEGTP